MPIRRLYSVLNSPIVSLINILNAKSRGWVNGWMSHWVFNYELLTMN
jgi:hypothetical protein